MKNYELKIKDLSGVWHTADLGDDVPAMNYQVNDIVELKDRQADYSQALKLPLSQNNKKIFGYSNIFNVQTEVPYKRLDCRLYSKDFELAGFGSYLRLIRITNYFEVQILSGNADLFDVLSKSEMKEIDLGYYVFGSVTSGNYYQSNDNYCLPEATFVKGGDNKLTPTRRYPFAYFENAIKKTINKHNYSLIHNIGDISKLAISVSSFNPGEGYVYSRMLFKDKPLSNGEIRIPAYSDETGSISQRSYQYPCGETAMCTHWTTIYTAKYDMVLSMRVILSKYRYYTGISDFNVKKYDINGTLQQTFMNGSYNTHNEVFEINILAGERIEVNAFKNDLSYSSGGIGVQPPSITIDISFTSITVLNYDKVGVGDRLYISPNIGFDKQVDLFKAFVQLFGLIISVDNKNKIIYAYTINKIYENKPIARDWSKKIHNGKNSSISKLSDYAQINQIKFHENTDDEVVDSIDLLVYDETLEKSKTMFDIAFEAGMDNQITDEYGLVKKVANIPIESGSAERGECKPHLVYISKADSTTGLRYEAKHSRLNSFTQYYQGLFSKMLKNVKIIEDEFYLTEHDIEEYRSIKDRMPGCFIPVYIEKYGSYFYINKIKNFMSGKLTKCELIKL